MRKAGAVEFLFAKPMTTAQVKAAIRHDPRLSDPVRRQALKLAGSYAQRLVRHAAERVVHALYDGAMFQAEVLESLAPIPPFPSR